VGGALHALNFGCSAQEYYEQANDEILVVIQAEHVEAVDRAEEIYSVPGIDAVFIGPNDLAASMRTSDGKPPSSGEFEDCLGRIREACARTGVAAGLHVFSIEEAQRRIAEGFRFLAVNSELKFMLEGASKVAKALAPEGRAGELARY
jgi:4-hydroxy-2-oxoheptanedioate aldolase